MQYGLGIDLGTTQTAAAVRVEGRIEVVRLGGRRAEIPSLVFVRPDGGLLIGEAADRRGQTEPARLAREFKRRIGDPVPILVGGAPFSAHALTAKLLRHVLDAVAQLQDGPPAVLTVTHPANWGPYKRELLDQALRLADTGPVLLRTEPEAAALQHATARKIAPGETVAVYDLGGGTFDAAVLRREGEGFQLLGEPEGIEQLGGADFDEAVFGHVLEVLGGMAEGLDPNEQDVITALARLRRDCVEAKEALSFDTEVMIPVALPGLHTRVRLNRSELESMIAPSLEDTVAAMHRALRAAQVAPEDLDAVLLAGGSSRIPLVSQLLSTAFDRPVVADPHPEHSIAMGAAVATALITGGASPFASAVAPPPVPKRRVSSANAGSSPVGAGSRPSGEAAAVSRAGTTVANGTPTQAGPGSGASPTPAVSGVGAGAQSQAASAGAAVGARPQSTPSGGAARPQTASSGGTQPQGAPPGAGAGARSQAASSGVTSNGSVAPVAFSRGAASVPGTVPAPQAPALGKTQAFGSAPPVSPGATTTYPPVSPAGPAFTPATSLPVTPGAPTVYPPRPPGSGYDVPPPARNRRLMMMVGAIIIAVIAGTTAFIIAMNRDEKDNKAGPATPPSAAPSVSTPPYPTQTMLIRKDTGGDFRPDRISNVYLLTPGQPERRLISNTGGDALPEWSRDRQKIALTRNLADDKNEIWVMDKDGSNQRKVIGNVTGGRVSWSTDGTKLAFMRVVGGTAQIFITKIDGSSEPVQLTTSGNRKDDPAWSPDGKEIAYWEDTDGGRQIYALTVTNPQEPGRQLTKGNEGPAVDPAWSPKGDMVAYTRGTGAETSDIWLVDRNGDSARKLTSDAAREMDPSWSPTDGWIAFTRGPLEKPKIVIVKADGTGEETLTKDGDREGHPCWS